MEWNDIEINRCVSLSALQIHFATFPNIQSRLISFASAWVDILPRYTDKCTSYNVRSGAGTSVASIDVYPDQHAWTWMDIPSIFNIPCMNLRENLKNETTFVYLSINLNSQPLETLNKVRNRSILMVRSQIQRFYCCTSL